MKPLLPRFLVVSALAFLLPACGPSGPVVLGREPAGESRRVEEVLRGPTNAVQVVRGTLVEKCPVAGCWFVLKDGSGTLHVDTKAAGFVVVDVPLRTELTVSGRLERDGDGWQLVAEGLRY